MRAHHSVADPLRVYGRRRRRLIAQIQRILDINHLSVVTSEVVEAARESLVIGVM